MDAVQLSWSVLFVGCLLVDCSQFATVDESDSGHSKIVRIRVPRRRVSRPFGDESWFDERCRSAYYNCNHLSTPATWEISIL